MFTILIGAAIGALFGGVIGAIIGGAAAWYVRQWLQRSIVGGLRLAQSELVESTFSIMGAISKADGVVTRDEINAAEQVFDLLRLEGEMREKAKAAFNRGKQPDFDVDAAVDRFAAVARGRGPLVALFLQMQVMAVAADGRIHPAEHTMLVRIARRLGLAERDVSQLEALMRAAQAGPSTPGGPPPADRLADAYAALGVTPKSSGAEIKRAYRRLISENHPDKLASRGLPDSMRAVAEERSREINSAYDLIKSARPDVK